MIRHHFLFKKRICLHPHLVFDIMEKSLDNTIIVGDICDLVIVDSVHNGACGAHIVTLLWEAGVRLIGTTRGSQYRAVTSNLFALAFLSCIGGVH